VAAHAWEERPLRRLLDLVDVRLLLDETDREETAAVAKAWGLERVWAATLAAADAVLGGRPEPWTLRTWARNTPAARGRTRAEELLERALAPYAAMPAPAATRCSARALAKAMNPRSGETLTGRLRSGPYEHPALAPDFSSRAPFRAPD
jgi:hypothetical protein